MKKEDIHILVVDDEDLILNMFQQSLENWGYRVDTATNGQEALRRCQENSYHVVITDLNMPELDGMGLLKRIKARWPFIEVIVVTGFATIEAAIEAMKMGAYDFILKPVNFDQVKFTVNNCYLKIKAQSENEELRELNAQLKELNDMKDKFLSITNHEIRTPLTIIRGYLEILNDLLEEPDSEIKEIIEILNAATRDLYDTVERIHILYKLNKGSRFARMEEVEITTIVNQVGKEMRRLFE